MKWLLLESVKCECQLKSASNWQWHPLVLCAFHTATSFAQGMDVYNFLVSFCIHFWDLHVTDKASLYCLIPVTLETMVKNHYLQLLPCRWFQDLDTKMTENLVIIYPSQDGVWAGEETLSEGVPIQILPLSLVADVTGLGDAVWRAWTNQCCAFCRCCYWWQGDEYLVQLIGSQSSCCLVLDWV